MTGNCCKPLACLVLGAMCLALPALAQQPSDWQIGFQPAAEARMENIIWMHSRLMWILGTVCLVLLGVLIYVALRFNERANPTPNTVQGNTMIEVVWTILPVLILVVIAISSFPILYRQDAPSEADLTIMAIGKQWYWTYEYPDRGNFTFDARMVPESRSAPIVANGEPRLLGASNRVVVPINANVHLLVTASDVIHSWAIPSFGVKIDAIPGRMSEAWFRPNREGVYYGQCSELCGARHAFMPIAVEVVSRRRFAEWVVEAKARFGSVDAFPKSRVALDAQ